MSASPARENIENVRTLPEIPLWDSISSYNPGDVVREGNISYAAITTTTIGLSPLATPAEWKEMVDGLAVTSISGSGGTPDSKRISGMVQVTAAEYSAIIPPEPGILYVVKG